jgi:hypothetical protein
VDYAPDDKEIREIRDKEDANLIGSYIEIPGMEPGADESIHMPTLDIDFPCHLRESETPGHFHLLIDKPMPWHRYKALLAAMVDAGLLEEGYVNASIQRGATFLALKPWKGGKGGN